MTTLRKLAVVIVAMGAVSDAQADSIVIDNTGAADGISSGVLTYAGQTLLAPAGFAQDLTFLLRNTNSNLDLDSLPFNILVVEMALGGGTLGLHPTTVLFESPTIVLPEPGLGTTLDIEVTVNLGGLDFIDGQILGLIFAVPPEQNLNHMYDLFNLYLDNNSTDLTSRSGDDGDGIDVPGQYFSFGSQPSGDISADFAADELWQEQWGTIDFINFSFGDIVYQLTVSEDPDSSRSGEVSFLDVTPDPGDDDDDSDVISVPEPSTLALLSLGLLGIGLTRKR